MIGNIEGRFIDMKRYLMSDRGQHALKMIGTGSALLPILAMFIFVGPPHDAGTEGAAMQASLVSSYDMREPGPAIALTETSGLLTTAISPIDVLEVLGAEREQAEAALLALEGIEKSSLGQLQPGKRVTAHFGTVDGARTLIGVSMRPFAGTALYANRQADGSYIGAALTARLQTAQRHINGKINSTLNEALVAGGGSIEQARSLTAMFGYTGNIARNTRPGEAYQFVFDVYEDERGNLIEAGDILYASIGTRGAYYQYTAADTGITDYYTPEGRTAERFLTRKPLKASYISSGFGRRRHPLHGYIHTHTGVDYVAPMSTHVYAAGAGVIEAIGRKGGYGRYMRIRHANGFKTAYAHLSGYDRTMHVGAKVNQGDLIGFVGNTGDVTGTHLHFEILRGDRQVNPLTLPLPTGRNLALTPAEFARFRARKREIDAMRGEDAPKRRLEIAATASASNMRPR